MQNDIGANKISKEKCHISHFDTCRRLLRYTFISAPTVSSCTLVYNAARLTLRPEELPGGFTEAERGRNSLYPPSEGRCPLTSVGWVGGIYLKATRDKLVSFGIRLC